MLFRFITAIAVSACVFQHATGADASAADSASNQSARQVQHYPGFEKSLRKVTTCSPEAQKWFDQGLQLLYGFNHDEAIRSFQKAAEVDPSCAMAWWGAAYARGLNINNPMMTEEQSRLAFEEMQKAKAAIDDESPVERGLIEAMSQRYQWPAPEDRTPLDEAYADAMEALWHQFPQDADVCALFAESLMNLQPWDLWTAEGAPKGRTLEIVAVLEKALQRTLDHPGLNHFYIHAIEASLWPEKGMEAAERLGSLVPGSGHLVHMPSHIFIRTGLYEKAAKANEQAIAADEAYFQLAPPPEFYSLYFIHNVHFLAYSEMMRGRSESALAAARKIENQIPLDFLKENVAMADGFLPTTLHVLIRFGRWEEILLEPEPEDWQLVSRAERHFARSLAYSALGETDKAQQELDDLDTVTAELTDEWKIGNNDASFILRIARTMAAGELEFAKGNSEKAFELLREAVELEDQLSYDEPPGWMQPVRHALGALLLAENTPETCEEAEAVYREDLKRHPHNAWSLLGLQQALGRNGKADEAAAMQEELDLAWKDADVQPVASCYCHPDARTVKPKAEQ